MKLSIVVPVFNESAGIIEFHNEILMPAIKDLGLTYEIVYVNDGSKDDSIKKLKSIALKDKKVKIIDLSKNFGKEIALTAGLIEADGDIIVSLDADGQHPPKYIPALIEEYKKGAQIVVGVRQDQNHEGIVKRIGSKLFYKIFNSIADEKIIPKSTDFRLISKDVQLEFKKLTEHNRTTKGLIDWLGFNKVYIGFESPKRLAGKSSYKTSALVKLAVNSFISLSLKPLFIFGYIGLIITTVSFLLGAFIFIEQILLQDPLNLSFTGSAMLGILISFLVGIVLLSQALLAVYISHIYEDSKSRPLFVINYKNSENIKNEK
ncbi:MAG TPA: glycosyltransferase family 2 protein [Candidatus Saccharibacteria bacterium]|nr:glycosyltransferase family 2 protein [Candidatus Saccharibacteria bacterium]